VYCVDMPDADAGIDIDTPEEYDGLLQAQGMKLP